MGFGGGGWKPSNRRSRRRGRANNRPTEKGADRRLLIVLALFCVAALALVIAVGVATT